MDRVHIVGFSGGIDSQACALWVRREFPTETIYLVNSDAGGNEHPITTEFLNHYSANVFPITFVNAVVADLGGIGTVNGRRRDLGKAESDPLTFGDMAFVKGVFPSSQAQFCTTYLKLQPQLRWVQETFATDPREVIRYVGVRADESKKRRNLPETQWDDFFDCELRRPLIDWTKQQCFDYCTGAGEEFNPLYKLGFDRVGCAPCINSSKEEVNRWATFFPEMIEKVRRWEFQCGRTFFPPCVPGMTINFVDEVVKWSRTARGGKQGMLPMIEAELEGGGGCASKYKICE